MISPNRSVSRAALMASAAAVLCLMPAQALGRDAADANAQMREASETIIVTATRTRLPNFDYPGLASVIDLEWLEADRPSDLADTLREIPGLEVTGGPRRTGQTLSLRGFGRENIALLIDGARQNFSSAHDGVLFLDPGLLSRVETVRGAASALYGSGASGGVIAFETANADTFLLPGETRGARLSAGYRSGNEEMRGSAAVFGRNEAFSGLLAVSARSSGDIALGSGNDLPADDEVVSWLANGEWRATPSLTLTGGILSFRNEAVEPNNGQGAQGVSGLNPLVQKDVSADTYRLGLRFAPADQPLIGFEATLYRTDGAVDEFDPLASRSITRDLTTTGIRAENRSEFAPGGQAFALTFGGEWYEDEQTGTDSATASGIRGGVPNGTTRFYGAYVQGEAEFDAGGLGRVIVLPGVRWDRFESRSDVGGDNQDEAISPRLGVTWAPVEPVRLFANWSKAFRAPSLNELYLDGTHFSLPHPVLGAPNFITNEFVANPDLRPESSETIEIGAGFAHTGLFTASDRFEIKGAWFRTRAEDLINLGVDFTFDPTCFAPPFFAPCSAGTSFSENLDSAELTGFEIAALYQNGPLTLSGAVFEVDGKDRITGAPLGSLQPVRGHVRASYAFEQADIGARLSFAGDFDRTSAGNERDSYAVLDVFAGWRPFTDRRVRVDLGVENVFDTDYERVFAGVSEAGRTFRIDLTWTGGW
ncbi:TonB-dependent receptor [Glycocaulis sp.]|uniref:TonB-dependent receptor domain-containing protein n=1 Tax=Glycocaulis sp. TaxID=1969725 RepID=UPI0025C5FD23|nr:TonB-dependent receptor [Glycocaulis sp.]MCH8520538.1 TonB-dependent receptor [Glycocaulis sp.]